MTGGWRALGLIPARGGSKGIPGKNIRLVNGEPLIAYTIRSAQQSRLLTDLVVSTDSTAIAELAARYRVEVLMRPAELAQDDTPAAPVAIHALDVLKSRGREYESLVLLQPTCPLRSAKDIDDALTLLMGSDHDAVVSVYQVSDHHPARMYSLEGNRLIPYDKAGEQLNRQDLPAVYHRNGVVYAIREQALRRERTFNPRNKAAYVMPRERSVNVDEEVDLLIAEQLLKACESS